jgi:hypothetical protein
MVAAILVFVSVFISGLVGLSLRGRLPDQHLQEASLGMIRLGAGVIGTLTALVLGLLIASAKANYDRVNDDFIKGATAVLYLDRTLAQYGPETAAARSLLRTAVQSATDAVFSKNGGGASELGNRARLAVGEKLQSDLQQLKPQNDAQRMLQARALNISGEVAQTRLLAINQAEGSIPEGLFLVLVLWLSIMFAGFGLVTAKNATVIVTLFLCALSLGGAVLMIDELNRPLEGFMKISDAPMRYALAHLGE